MNRELALSWETEGKVTLVLLCLTVGIPKVRGGSPKPPTTEEQLQDTRDHSRYLRKKGIEHKELVPSNEALSWGSD